MAIFLMYKQLRQPLTNTTAQYAPPTTTKWGPFGVAGKQPVHPAQCTKNNTIMTTWMMAGVLLMRT